MEGLKPWTTYYYRVTSEESNGKSDGMKSTVNKFTTPGPGERSWLTLNAIDARPSLAGQWRTVVLISLTADG